MTTPRTLFLIAIVVAAAIYRIVPHPFNFTPVLAIALFSGAKFERRSEAIIIPIAAMFLSDIILGFHSTMLFVYLSLLFIVLFGYSINHQTNQRVINKPKSRSKLQQVLKLFLSAVFSTGIFFLVSNFGTWVATDLYPHNIYGLWQCYLAAIPFMQNSLMGTILFSGIIFGGFYLAENRFKFLQPLHH